MMNLELSGKWEVEAWKSSSSTAKLMLLDSNGRIIWHNYSTFDTEVLPSYIRVMLEDKQVSEQWQTAISALAHFGPVGRRRIVSLEKPHEFERFLAGLTAFETQCGRVYGLEIRGFVCLDADEKADLARVTDMSPAEIRLFCHTLNGSTLNDVSSVLGISIETARTHMRRIYSKLGVNSREALFAASAILL